MFNSHALRLKQLVFSGLSILYSVSPETRQERPPTPPKLRSRCDTGYTDTLHQLPMPVPFRP